MRMPDQTRRVVASSMDGDILGGIDIPIEVTRFQSARQWAAGATMAMTTDGRRELGAFVDRDLGPLRLGVELQQRREGWAVVLRAGWRF